MLVPRASLGSSKRRRASALARALSWLGLAGLLASANASAADPSVEVLQWRHPNPGEVAHFDLLFAAAEGQEADSERIDVGLPRVGDIYLWTIEVPEGGSIWVAVEAIGRDGVRSDPSAWRRYDWAPQARDLGEPGRAFLVP